MFGFNTQSPQPIGEDSSYSQQQAIPFYQTSQELGKLMLETKKENREAYLKLLGMIEQEDGKVIKVDEPLMNNKGAGQMLVLLDSINNLHTFLTKIDDYTVVITIHRIWKNMIKMLLRNENEWALPEDRAKWSLIREIIVTPIIFALRRGENGVEKEFFRATHESKTLVNQGTTQKFKTGFFG